MKQIYFALIVFLVIFISCKKETNSTPDQFVIGKNYYTTIVDNETREYYVHVPTSYDKSKATPVVFMLHGTGGDGLKFYNISGWKELGESKNVITVFPSSWHYCIIDDEGQKNTTKWHSLPSNFVFCSGEVPKDDIKFLRQVLSEIKSKFNVDNNKIYLAGFSNGGEMAFRCAVEMSDVFAAITENSGSYFKDTNFVAKRKLPIFFQLGNSDDKWLNSKTAFIPMTDFDSILNNNLIFQNIVNTHVKSFGFLSNYTKSGNVNNVLTATYLADNLIPAREFKVALIKDLDHQYPNGVNHWMKGAEVQWDWFKNYSLN